jgi:hypothetical protein
VSSIISIYKLVSFALFYWPDFYCFFFFLASARIHLHSTTRLKEYSSATVYQLRYQKEEEEIKAKAEGGNEKSMGEEKLHLIFPDNNQGVKYSLEKLCCFFLLSFVLFEFAASMETR